MDFKTLGFVHSAMGAVLVAALIAASPAVADDGVLAVAPNVIEFYNGAYKNLKQPRAIAVAADGYHYGYSYCPEYRCYINPSARALALQACAQSGGRGCRIFAIGDDIEVNYRVMNVVVRALQSEATAAPTANPPLPFDCGQKPTAECSAAMADYREQRGELEAKWAGKIKEVERRHCKDIVGGPYYRPAECVQFRNEAEAERGAELRALDQEFQLSLGQ